jgi:protein gp37
VTTQRAGGISWTDETWNPIRGCSRVSEGCRNCYAERVAARFRDVGQPYHGLVRTQANGQPQWTGETRIVPEKLDEPLRWKRPRRVFVNSMSDLFHENVEDETIDLVFAIMALAPQHTFQVLTKRPERMRRWFDSFTGDDPDDRGGFCAEALYCLFPDRSTENVEKVIASRFWRGLPNVWLGVSVEDQATADERIPPLLQTPAAVRFVSAEPLLGPIVFKWAPKRSDGKWMCTDCCWGDRCDKPSHFHRPECPTCGGTGAVSGLDWIIVGGESGPGARPMHPQWARDIRDQCKASGVPFHFKQWGEWAPDDVVFDCGQADGVSYTSKTLPRRFQCMELDGAKLNRVGKQPAGRLLDGVEHAEFPETGGAA